MLYITFSKRASSLMMSLKKMNFLISVDFSNYLVKIRALILSFRSQEIMVYAFDMQMSIC